MIRKNSYVTFGQIQKTKEDYYIQKRQGMKFKNAVSHLIDTHTYFCGDPETPDFLSWNLLNCHDLKALIYQIPIYIHEILDIKDNIEDNILYLTVLNKVQISMESCYNDNTLLSVGYFLIVYVLEGNCTLNLRNSSRTMQIGELCILPPNCLHSLYSQPEDLVISIASDKNEFQKNFNELLHYNNVLSAFFRKSLFQNCNECIYFMLPPTKDIRSIIQHLFSEFIAKDIYSTSLFNNYLQIFYSNIIRCTENTYKFYSTQKKVTAHILMPSILEYINKNYHTLTLDILSAHFNYESAYLSKMIKASTGKNFSKIINELKIREACELLKTTTYKIEEISELIGFHSSDHFTYMFKNTIGTTPRKYRTNNRSC